LTVTGSLLWDACGMTTGLAPAVRFGPALLVVVFGLGGLSVINYGWLFPIVRDDFVLLLAISLSTQAS
jgi:hypothetical protein